MVTFCACRKRWGEMLPCQPSSFLEELDPKHLQELSYTELAAKPAEEDVAKGYFSSMKAKLSTVEGFQLGE